MMPAVHAKRRASLAVIPAAGVEGADAGVVEVGQQLFESHGDHHSGGAATGLRQVLRRDGLDQLGQRDAVADGGGQVGVDPGRSSVSGGAGG